MRGYIAIVHRHADEAYEAEFPDLPVESCIEQNVDAALHRARCALNEFAGRTKRALPRPRPSHEMIKVATRCGAVAAMCILPRPG